MSVGFVHKIASTESQNLHAETAAPLVEWNPAVLGLTNLPELDPIMFYGNPSLDYLFLSCDDVPYFCTRGVGGTAAGVPFYWITMFEFFKMKLLLDPILNFKRGPFLDCFPALGSRLCC